MVSERCKALQRYARTIQEFGSLAGEPVIEREERRWPEFRNVAYAVAIILRARELLGEES